MTKLPSPVYLDYNATTPIAPEVLEAMLPYLRDGFGNPSSLHAYGRRAKSALTDARESVAVLVGATPRDVSFTGGGTEADNLAILGILDSAEESGRRHLIASNIEHHAVLHVIQHLEKNGWPVTLVEVDSSGWLAPETLEAAIRPDTLLVSVMAANNETGVVQPVAELSEIAHRSGALFHTDAVQACGKIPVDVEALGADLLSLSAHKFYGPKGTGALYVRKGTPFRPVFRGGGQERARRPGTHNVAGIVGLAEAARQARSRLSSDGEHLTRMRDGLETRVLDDVPGSHVNGAGAERTPNTANFRFDGVDGEKLVMKLDRKGFAVSTGAACSSGAVEPSHVLVGMGLDPEDVQGSIRVSLGRYTKEEETRAFADALVDAVSSVRKSKEDSSRALPV